MNKANIERCKETSFNPSLSYMPAIDGLRALAVISVMINHFNNNLLPSGYLGVDIFFVISGFVITSSLANRKDKRIGVFLLGFYTRRFKRLAPALTLCIVCTCILISLFSPHPKVYLKTGISSLLGLSNLSLYLNALDYWGHAAKLNPFTHTWSLGVEEQFYLILPLIMWFSVLGRWTDVGFRHLLWFITTISFASLIGFIYISDVNQSAAYFLMPFRFWELGAGCLLFLLLKNRKGFINASMGKAPPLVIIAAMIAALFIPLEFSVQATIVVVTLTTLLLACIRMEKQGYSLLAHPILVYIGIISYSLYLWHWVVLVISLWTIGIHWWSIPIQLGLSVLLAVGSYHFVERPLRHASWFLSRNNTIRFGIFSTIGFGLLLFLFLTSTSNILYLGDRDSKGRIEVPKILKSIKCSPTQLPIKKSKKTVRVIGNSHSLHIIPMLEMIADKCGLTLIHEKHPDYIVIPSGDGKHIDKLDEVLLDLKKGDILILSSRNQLLYSFPFLNYRGDKWVDRSEYKEKNGFGLHVWLLELDSVINKTSAKGVNVVLILPNVEFDEQVLPSDYCNDEWFRLHPRGCDTQVSRDFLGRRFPIQFYHEVNSMAEANINFYTFDPLPIYCSGSQGCSRFVGGVNAFNDTNHLTKEGALLMLDEFNSFLLDNHLLN